MVYYDFDNTPYAVDHSHNDFKLMPSSYGMIQFDELPLVDVKTNLAPKIGIGYGSTRAMELTFFHKKLKEPIVVFEQQAVNYHFDISKS